MNFSNSHFNVKNYTDIQGLTSLKGKLKHNPEESKKEVAQQFESLLMQMLMQSMRNANKAFSNEEGHSDAFDMYQELFDKQVSMSVSGLGLAQQIEAQLKAMTPTSMEEDPSKVHTENDVKSNVAMRTKENNSSFSSPTEFIKGLWTYAKSAAAKLGLNPKVLLAQAALETNWGKRIISSEEQSSHNLFNIKADHAWKKDSIKVSTMEERDGALTEEKSAFRKYESFADSFNDYVDFIQSNSRYEKARQYTHNPESYLRLLQEAHYATDSKYADKIMSIYNSKHFNEINSL